MRLQLIAAAPPAFMLGARERNLASERASRGGMWRSISEAAGLLGLLRVLTAESLILTFQSLDLFGFTGRRRRP